jgi:hypothetical protein
MSRMKDWAPMFSPGRRPSTSRAMRRGPRLLLFVDPSSVVTRQKSLVHAAGRDGQFFGPVHDWPRCCDPRPDDEEDDLAEDVCNEPLAPALSKALRATPAAGEEHLPAERRRAWRDLQANEQAQTLIWRAFLRALEPKPEPALFLTR